MTMPTIIGKYRNQERSAQLKKFYSSIQQAILLSENENGPMEYWSKEAGDVKNEDDERDFEANKNSAEAFFNTYLKNYLKHFKSGVPDENNSVHDYEVWLADGNTMYLHNGSCMDIIVDINGAKKPNLLGYDQFQFLLCAGNTREVNQAQIGYCGKKRFCSYGITLWNTRESALAACKEKAYRCSSLLQLDNWEFKDDYPYKY